MLPGKTYTPGEIARIAWHRRWAIAIPLAVCPFVTLLVSAQLPDVYQSDMLMQIVPQRVPDSYVRSTVTLRTDERIMSLAQQILSRTQLEQMIHEFDLYPRERARLPFEDVIEKMRLNIQVDVERGQSGRPPDAFHVRFTYVDPTVAARVTQRLGTLFADFNTRDRGALAEATDQFLASQLAEARARLEAQEKKVETFRLENQGRLPSELVFNMQAIQTAQLQLQALVESLARDRDRLLMLQRLYNDARAEPAVAGAPTAGSTTQAAPADPTALPAAASTTAQLKIARDALARLELHLKPEHPDIVRLKRLITELQVKADAEASASSPDVPAADPAVTPQEQAQRQRLSEMQAEMESLARQIGFKESEEKRLQDRITDYQSRIEATPGNESEWLTLTRDYDTLQATYRDMLMKSESARVATDLEHRQIGEQFHVLDPARVPVRPIGPKRLLINSIGVLLGLLFGLGCAALLELRDTSLRTQEDVREVLALPVLALVPSVMSDLDRRRLRRRRYMVSIAVTLAGAAAAFAVWSLRLWNFIV